MAKVITEKFAFTQYADGIEFNGKAVATAFVVPVVLFQGTVSGYTSGGKEPISNVIDKFPFASNANATDVGDLTQGRYGPAGQSSGVSGYTSGGTGPTNLNVIDKFPFATDGNATDVGDLTQARGRGVTGQSSIEYGYGYSSGGFVPGAYSNTIDKFPFASNANATDVGDLTRTTYSAAGQSSTVSGYTSGGFLPATNIIDKFPFASNANATDVGDLSQARGSTEGQSSDASGYTSGGESPSLSPGLNNTIDKFPFSANANATDVGDLVTARSFMAGQSSTTSGYVSGGLPPSNGNNIIEKFPFATNANSTDVGDLTIARRASTGQQV